MWKTSSMWVPFFPAVVTTLSLRSHIRLCMRRSFTFSSIDVNNCLLKPFVIDLRTLIVSKYNLTKLLSCIVVVLLGSSRADHGWRVQYVSVLVTTERALLCLCVASNCASVVESLISFQCTCLHWSLSAVSSYCWCKSNVSCCCLCVSLIQQSFVGGVWVSQRPNFWGNMDYLPYGRELDTNTTQYLSVNSL